MFRQPASGLGRNIACVHHQVPPMTMQTPTGAPVPNRQPRSRPNPMRADMRPVAPPSRLAGGPQITRSGRRPAGNTEALFHPSVMGRGAIGSSPCHSRASRPFAFFALSLPCFRRPRHTTACAATRAAAPPSATTPPVPGEHALGLLSRGTPCNVRTGAPIPQSEIPRPSPSHPHGKIAPGVRPRGGAPVAAMLALP